MQSTCERVLDVARKMSAENGYERTTVAAIVDSWTSRLRCCTGISPQRGDPLHHRGLPCIVRRRRASVDKGPLPDDRLCEMVQLYVLLQPSWRSDVERYEIMIRCPARSRPDRRPSEADHRTAADRAGGARAILRSGVQ
ncbi:hypothetical protein HBB16_17585 [Pseudonocardia sp. MCCB 268]|nr:hypothetical protein [Pseudonocardia cytotoxica]